MPLSFFNLNTILLDTEGEINGRNTEHIFICYYLGLCSNNLTISQASKGRAFITTIIFLSVTDSKTLCTLQTFAMYCSLTSESTTNANSGQPEEEEFAFMGLMDGAWTILVYLIKLVLPLLTIAVHCQALFLFWLLLFIHLIPLCLHPPPGFI